VRDLSLIRGRGRSLRAPIIYAGCLVGLAAILFFTLDLPRISSARKSSAAPAAAVTPAPAAAAAAPAEPDPAPAEAPKAGAPQRFVKAVNLTADVDPLGSVSQEPHPPLTDRASYVQYMLQHTSQSKAFLEWRWDCAQAIVSLGHIEHQRVLEGFLLTPREEFCRQPSRAYENAAWAIGYGQTISGPYLVARMTDALNPQPDQRVLEVGTGSGYQSAFLAELSRHVYSIEIVEDLARETDQIYRRLWDRFPEFRNVHRKVDDGYYGWREYAPFDRIIVTCGIDHIPPELLRQLAPEGIMVIPVGPPSGQTILRIVKHVAADGTVSLEREDIYHGQNVIIFVPFTSKSGLHRDNR
jgi:protein-L-isoaspartate(D-aspartate) O-methyltransferase